MVSRPTRQPLGCCSAVPPAESANKPRCPGKGTAAVVDHSNVAESAPARLVTLGGRWMPIAARVACVRRQDRPPAPPPPHPRPPPPNPPPNPPCWNSIGLPIRLSAWPAARRQDAQDLVARFQAELLDFLRSSSSTSGLLSASFSFCSSVMFNSVGQCTAGQAPDVPWRRICDCTTISFRRSTLLRQEDLVDFLLDVRRHFSLFSRIGANLAVTLFFGQVAETLEIEAFERCPHLLADLSPGFRGASSPGHRPGPVLCGRFRPAASRGRWSGRRQIRRRSRGRPWPPRPRLALATEAIDTTAIATIANSPSTRHNSSWISPPAQRLQAPPM